MILATDGDFNVGVSSNGELVKMIEHERESGLRISTAPRCDTLGAVVRSAVAKG